MKDPDEMVDLIKYKSPEGRTTFVIQCRRSEVRWLRAFFAHTPRPFKTLRDMGFLPESGEGK